MDARAREECANVLRMAVAADADVDVPVTVAESMLRPVCGGVGEAKWSEP